MCAKDRKPYVHPWYRRSIYWIIIGGAAALLILAWWKTNFFGMLGPWPVTDTPRTTEKPGDEEYRRRIIVSVNVANWGRAGEVECIATYIQHGMEFTEKTAAHMEAGESRPFELIFEEKDLKKGPASLICVVRPKR